MANPLMLFALVLKRRTRVQIKDLRIPVVNSFVLHLKRVEITAVLAIITLKDE